MHEPLSLTPLTGMPLFREGLVVADEVLAALARSGETLRPGDVVVLAQKIVSKAEGRTVDLGSVAAGEAAAELSRRANKPPSLARLILDESSEIVRATPAAVIARHRTGHVLANAGIDASNVEGAEAGEVLLWPVHPDASARAIRAGLAERSGVAPGVVIADSMGRAWRIGTVGAAIGCAGLAVLDDRRGRDADLYGRTLTATVIAVADAVAAAAVLVMGEGAQGTPAVLVRGAGRWVGAQDGNGAASVIRPLDEDLFR